MAGEADRLRVVAHEHMPVQGVLTWSRVGPALPPVDHLYWQRGHPALPVGLRGRAPAVNSCIWCLRLIAIRLSPNSVSCLSRSVSHPVTVAIRMSGASARTGVTCSAAPPSE